MGLCKCSQKKVTNQFCFEHRVNVCEHCMVAEHPKCVVQSYLQWLNDSDYNPVCRICDEQLAVDDCIRLVCYDVFHQECLNKWASKLPAHTAPAGYKCPVCSKPIFPPTNLVSPVADAIKHVLSSWSWAKAGLGLPLLDNNTEEHSYSSQNDVNHRDNLTENDNKLPGSTAISRPAPTHGCTDLDDNVKVSQNSIDGSNSISVANYVPAIADTAVAPAQYRNDATNASGVSRKISSSDSTLTMPHVEADDDDDKYKRRSTFDWFSRWWRTMHRPSSRHHQGLLGGRRRMIALLTVLGICSILVLFSYLGRERASDNPFLDPLNNPNIHIEQE